MYNVERIQFADLNINIIFVLFRKHDQPISIFFQYLFPHTYSFFTL